jgi:hypothetical protein
MRVFRGVAATLASAFLLSGAAHAEYPERDILGDHVGGRWWD